MSAPTEASIELARDCCRHMLRRGAPVFPDRDVKFLATQFDSAIAKEREECALVADKYQGYVFGAWTAIAKLIRARGRT